jgi:hypothetical protein
VNASYERYRENCTACGYPEPVHLGPIGAPSHPLVHRLGCPRCAHLFPAFPPGFVAELQHAPAEARQALADTRYLAGPAEPGDAEAGWPDIEDGES